MDEEKADRMSIAPFQMIQDGSDGDGGSREGSKGSKSINALTLEKDYEYIQVASKTKFCRFTSLLHPTFSFFHSVLSSDPTYLAVSYPSCNS